MIDAEKILGGLLKQSLRQVGSPSRKKRTTLGLGSLAGSGLGKVLGIGALGVAIAAFDHFFVERAEARPPSGPPPPGSGPRPSGPPPPPGAAPGPPLHGASRATRLELPPERLKGPVLLIRAMIAAANADGDISEEERHSVIARFDEVGLSAEERGFILSEFTNPPSIDSLLRDIDSEELANQVYTVSLLAINVDSKAELDYLDYLRRRLNLKEEVVGKLHETFGLDSQEAV